MPLTWENLKTEFLGRVAVVEVVQNDAMGNQLSHEQVFGTIKSADPQEGIAIELGGLQTGKTLLLPGDLKSFSRMPPGLFKLLMTGEELDSPDFYTRCTISHRSMVGLPGKK